MIVTEKIKMKVNGTMVKRYKEMGLIIFLQVMKKHIFQIFTLKNLI